MKPILGGFCAKSHFNVVRVLNFTGLIAKNTGKHQNDLKSGQIGVYWIEAIRNG